MDNIFYDSTGLEISDGDLLQVFHFCHYIRREKQYMYKVARLIDGTWYGLCLNQILQGVDIPHKYRLKSMSHSNNELYDTKVLSKREGLDFDKFKIERSARIRLKNKSK